MSSAKEKKATSNKVIMKHTLTLVTLLLSNVHAFIIPTREASALIPSEDLQVHDNALENDEVLIIDDHELIFLHDDTSDDNIYP